MSSEDDTKSTDESDRESDSEHDSETGMRMETHDDAPYGVDLDGNMYMERDGDSEQVEDKEKENEVEENEDDDEYEDEDEGKDCWTIGKGEMVNSSADDVHIMVDNQPTVRREQGQEMREHTTPPPLPASAPQPQTPEPRQRPQTPETHPLSWLEFWRLLTPQIPHPATPTLKEAKTAGNTADVDVEQQLLVESAADKSLPSVSLPNVPLSDIPLSDVPLPNVPVSNVPLPKISLPEARPGGSVDMKWTSPCITEEACVRIRVWFLFCGFSLL